MSVPNAPAADAPDPWLTPEQVGRELSTHPATIRLWLREGRLNASKTIGGKWRVRRSEVDRMLIEQTRSRGRGGAGARAADPYAPPAKGPGAGVLDTLSER